jgi:hypothetical protein
VNVRAMPLASALMVCVLPLSAQDAAAPTEADAMPFRVVARWDSSRYLSGRTTLTFDLARSLAPGERLAVLIGSSDVSGAVRVHGRRADYDPAALRLPSGTTDAVVYVVSRDGEWREAGRATLRVRTRAGLDRNAATPSVDLASSGQLGQHVPGGAPEPARRTWQDLTLRLGFTGLGARGSWETSFQSNAVGVSEKTQRLRWGERQERAPALDLTDYRMQVLRGPVRVAVGNLSVGANPYLLSGFGSRGITASAQVRRGIAIETGVLNGTNVVGWDNLLGVSNGDHRMLTAGVDLELVPGRPGAFEVDIQALEGAVLPRTSYTQGAVTDAERSRGYGVQLRLSNASQRIRLAGGITRSRFRNPNDPLLQGDTTLVPVRSETRAARSGELGIDLLRELRLFRSTRASLGATARHERIDPLFRSVGAFVQGDMQQNTAELNGTVGALVFQGVIARGRDNLANIPSILTTHTTRRALSLAAPIHGLLGMTARAWLPLATFRWEGTIQAGDAVPVNGDFAATHVPDQYNRLRAASLSWSPDRFQIAYRWDESLQDNRQVGRERADIRARVHGLSIALNGSPRVTPALEASVERQDIRETAQQQRTSRVGTAIQAQVTRTLAFSANLAHTWSFDPFGERRTRNVELQSELSQGFTLYRAVDGGTQGRMFLRYARTRAVFLPFTPDPSAVPQLMWTLNGGTSIRLF